MKVHIMFPMAIAMIVCIQVVCDAVPLQEPIPEEIPEEIVGEIVGEIPGEIPEEEEPIPEEILAQIPKERKQMTRRGCSASKAMDVQLLLDSSGSSENYWGDIISYLKSDFEFTNPKSRLAVTKYGSKAQELQPLTGNVKGSWFNDPKYNWEHMGYTHTAESLNTVLETFSKSARWNDPKVVKVLIVVTEGDTNDPFIRLGDSIKAWKDKGVDTYAIGFGRASTKEKYENELKKISENYTVDMKKESLEKIKKKIIESLKVCT